LFPWICHVLYEVNFIATRSTRRVGARSNRETDRGAADTIKEFELKITPIKIIRSSHNLGAASTQGPILFVISGYIISRDCAATLLHPVCPICPSHNFSHRSKIGILHVSTSLLERYWLSKEPNKQMMPSLGGIRPSDALAKHTKREKLIDSKYWYSIHVGSYIKAVCLAQ
jgi:hypothetical protein